jgi:hypoxanthine phosphoribosyltransferase
MDIEQDIEQILLEKDVIREKVKELAAKISRDYKGKDPLLVGVLRGAVVFLADLAREITIPVAFDFMAVSSYGTATKTSGVVRILKDLDEDIKDRHVLLVEDIIDSGLTLNYLLKNLRSRKPASLEICALLQKDIRQKMAFGVKYEGFLIPNEFVVGYGLDYAKKYRNLPFIGTLKPRVYKDD